MAWSFDAAGKGQATGVTNATGLSYTITPAAGAALLVVGVTVNTGTISSVTYNSIAMTAVGTAVTNVGGGGSGVTNLYSITNPASGLNTVKITPSTTATVGSDAVSYLSLNGTKDVTNTFTSATGTITETLTPTQTNSLFVSFIDGQGPSQAAQTNCTIRSSDFTVLNHSIYDNAANALTGGVSFSMSQTGSGVGLSGVGCVFLLTGAVASTHFLTLTGAGV